MHLYKRVRPSFHLSVCPSICPSIRPSLRVRHTGVEFLGYVIFRQDLNQEALRTWNHTTIETIWRQGREQIARTHVMSELRQTSLMIQQKILKV